MTRTHAILALAALALAATRPAHAQDAYFPADATINYAINGSAYVGYANSTDRLSSANGTSPTVTFAPGGSIPFLGGGIGDNLYTYNRSTLNVTGGSEGGRLYAYDASTVTVTGGSVGGLIATNNSTVTVRGGTVYSVTADASGTVTVTGGTFTAVVAFLDNTTGAFTFIGTGLSATPTGPDILYGGTDYRLTGLLQNGQSVTGDIINVQPTATMFTLAAAPEPSPTAALALGALTLTALLLRAPRRNSLTA